MTPPALVGTVLDAKFQIEKALSSGAAGDVYEATHLGLGSRVAVKVLRPGIPETAEIRRKRFMREARVAARVQSDHVVRVFDIVAPEQGPTYIVMELLQGETLAERLRRVKHIAAGQAADYVMQAAKPLGDMHEAGIVHRDVKPSNLFLARDADGRERVKLLDFGVAAFCQAVIPRGSDLTLSEMVIGTPRYMAPEQFRDAKQVDGRADVWALGVTLYELLAGTPPFDGRTVLAVMNQIELQQPPPLQKRRADIPPALAALVHRCLAKDPALRPANGRALLEALAALGIASSPSSTGTVTHIGEASLQERLEERAESLDEIDAELLTTATPIVLPSPRRKMIVAAAVTGLLASIVLVAASGRVSRATSETPAPSHAANDESTASPATHTREAQEPPPPASLAPQAPQAPQAPPARMPLTAAQSAAPRPALIATTIGAREGFSTRRPAPRATAAPVARPAPKPAPRSAPARNSAGRSSTEDDDRIE